MTVSVAAGWSSSRRVREHSAVLVARLRQARRRHRQRPRSVARIRRVVGNVAPPLVDTCHCTVGDDANRLAAAVNVAAAGAVTVTLDGFVVTTGTVCTVNVATVVVAEPPVFVNTARYCVPFCAAVVAAIVNVVEVAPEIFVNVELPAGADCHCTVGDGEPLAAAVNDAEAPAFTVERERPASKSTEPPHRRRSCYRGFRSVLGSSGRRSVPCR